MSGQQAPALELRGLDKRYGKDVHALRGIDLEVRPGEIFGFLGPNGAGKSTAIRIVLDLIRPTRGRALVFGHDCQADGVAARSMMGYLPSDPAFSPRMTARQVFDQTAHLRGVTMDRAHLDALIERLRLDPSRAVSTLSRGNRQKVGLIQALVTKPAMVILDEPTTGLDPLIQAEVEAILHEVAEEGRTVFFSSHILEEVESICTRAAVLRSGAIVDVFDLAEQRRLAPALVEVTFAEPLPVGGFNDLPQGIRLLEQQEASASFEVRADIDPLVKRLAQHHVRTLVARPPTLEELFMRYYRGDDGDAGNAADGHRPAEEEAAS